MAKKIKTRRILMEDLDKNSSPCKICIAMTDREVEDNGNKQTFNYKDCTIELGPNYNKGDSYCTGVQRAQMRIEFLNYFEHKKPRTSIEKLVSKARVYLEKMDSNIFPCNINEIKTLLEGGAAPLIINEKLEDKTRLHQVSYEDITFYNTTKRLVRGLKKYVEKQKKK